MFDIKFMEPLAKAPLILYLNRVFLYEILYFLCFLFIFK